MSDIFVSYAREDQALVRDVVSRLEARGRKVWVDWQDIPPTAEWMSAISTAVAGAKAFLFVVSPDSCASEVCMRELEHALSLNKRMIVSTARPTDNDAIPQALVGSDQIPLADAVAVDAIGRSLEADGEWVAVHTRLLERAIEWDTRSSDKNLLLRGADLDEAETWFAAQKKDPAPTALQTQFALASRRAATSRQRGAITTSLAIAAIVALLSVIALVQRASAADRARLATSRSLASASGSARSSDAQLALLLALRAWDEKGTPQAEQAIRQVIITLRDPTKHGLVMDGNGSGIITDIAFTPDNRYLGIASGDERGRIWDFAKRDVFTLQGHSSPLHGGGLSKDGTRFATAADDAVRIWETATGRPITALPVDGSYSTAVAFTPDGKRLAVVGESSNVNVWDIATQAPVKQYTGGKGFTTFVQDVAYSPDGKWLAAAGLNGLRVWPVDKPTDPIVLKGHDGFVERVIFAPNGSFLATAGEDGTVRIWDWKSGAITEVLSDGQPIYGLDVSPDSTKILTTGILGGVALWKLGEDAWRVQVVPTGDRGNSVAFAPNGKVVALGTWTDKTSVVACEVCADTATVLKLARSLVKRRFTPAEMKQYSLS